MLIVVKDINKYLKFDSADLVAIQEMIEGYKLADGQSQVHADDLKLAATAVKRWGQLGSLSDRRSYEIYRKLRLRFFQLVKLADKVYLRDKLKDRLGDKTVERLKDIVKQLTRKLPSIWSFCYFFDKPYDLTLLAHLKRVQNLVDKIPQELDNAKRDLVKAWFQENTGMEPTVDNGRLYACYTNCFSGYRFLTQDNYTGWSVLKDYMLETRGCLYTRASELYEMYNKIRPHYEKLIEDPCYDIPAGLWSVL